ncbi:ECF transporter S component [Corynebacterium uberis]|uniref:ECF transporter S component n=1 Tax=Corynebacterium TaxID=1716 RepID=UPI001D0A7604|nr:MULTISPECIES: ECF transporter S component [Corynebacterium]MCZ9308984.1 ECF transporter S component [Corynebacterium sp. c6VSa_13]UDL74547.1 ECF transporter S component [Corynebacterium uberis]UDL76619.1 ECF transporter S component [Corynebacterium uberis]UDL78832.1 ECF transporter S component [Corynebacterium uberis]UDL81110.1 ECF transporter S component [Corynebacterium uberis]
MTVSHKTFLYLGAALIAATWVYVVALRPTEWDQVGQSGPALVTLVGYVAGALLLLAGTLPGLPARTVAIIPGALVLNIVIGELVGSFALPIYLDSLGTVLIAALAGPAVGTATGALSSVVWGLINPAALPFAAVSALTGGAAGVIARRGWLRSAWKLVASGAVLGAVCGMLAAPVAAFVYGGTAGLGTGALVSLLREMGNSLLAAVTLQSFLSDPLDKIIVLAVVAATIRLLPDRVLTSLGRRSEQKA